MKKQRPYTDYVVFKHKILLKLCLFLCMFFYFFPIQFNFPITPSNIVQLIGIIIALSALIKSNLRLNASIFRYMLLGTIIFIIGIFASIVLSHTNDLTFAISHGLYVILYISGAITITVLAHLLDNQNTYVVILKYLVYVSIIYASFSVLFFFLPDLYDQYSSIIQNTEEKQEINKSLSAYRLVGLSNKVNYANAGVHYGIIIWTILLLAKLKYTFFFQHKVISSLLILFFTTVGIFSARTFFIMIPFTVIYLYLLNKGKNRLYKTIKDIISFFLPTVCVGGIGISYLAISNPATVEWAFELFINISEGSASTGSTDTLLNMLSISPDNLKTWLFGDGRALTKTGFYMNTDVGYMRSIFYWGLVGTTVYYYFNYIYYRTLSRITIVPYVKIYFLMILVWFYVYNIKGFWSPLPFFSLFLVVFAFSLRNKLNL